ncbi:MAG: hypothetical protein ACLR2E_19670 [Lachnospiraceae bacterium]
MTYRVYDYGRIGKDGKPRELHVEKALEVTRREPVRPRGLRSPCGSLRLFRGRQAQCKK